MVAGETAKFLLECNVKFGRQQRGCWQQQSQIDDHLETEFGLRVYLGHIKKHVIFHVLFYYLFSQSTLTNIVFRERFFHF